MSEQNYPKTLILSESPPSSTNGFGATLATMLAGWPLDRLKILYRSRKFWEDGCGGLPETRERMVHAPLPLTPLTNPKHARELAEDLLPYLLGRTPSRFGSYSKKWIARQLDGWRPDVLYCWYYAPALLDYGAWLAEELDVPLVLHIGDIAPAGERDDSLSRIARKAVARIAISGEMKRDLEESLGLPFDVVHNGALDEIFAPPQTAADNDGTIVVRYVGALLRAHQFPSIEDIAEAVRVFNRQGGKARFELYGPEWTAKLMHELDDSDAVRYAGFAEKPRNYELLKTADLLVLPITFEEKEFEWVRLSMPTKLPEYLGSGAPVLVYGPRGCAPVEFCVENDVGIVQSTRSVDAIVETLKRLQADPAAAKERGMRDRRIAETEVSATAMRERLRSILQRAASAVSA